MLLMLDSDLVFLLYGRHYPISR